MDELMRHQPTLKASAIDAVVNVLHKLCELGYDSRYICWRPPSKSDSTSNPRRSTAAAEGSSYTMRCYPRRSILQLPSILGSSDEDDDEEEEPSTSSHNAHNDTQESSASGTSEKTPIQLVDYIINTMKFIDAILSNNTTEDHCQEFVNRGGLEPLLRILGLPNLNVGCPITASAQAVASVCKSILHIGNESRVLSLGLKQLNEVLARLAPLYSKTKPAANSSRFVHLLLYTLVRCVWLIGL